MPDLQINIHNPFTVIRENFQGLQVTFSNGNIQHSSQAESPFA
jgi:hypothetical protein